MIGPTGDLVDELIVGAVGQSADHLRAADVGDVPRRPVAAKVECSLLNAGCTPGPEVGFNADCVHLGGRVMR
ncbi:MAG: hypothetical protein GY788_30675 [bacterium]|nr:hypothetical protein [bacterium]